VGWLCVAQVLPGAPNNLAQLRAQLATAEEAEDKPAIVELSRRIVALTPNDVAAWERIARAQFDLKDFDRCAETLDAWQKAIKQPPAAIEDFRGDLAAKEKNYAEAERHWLAFLARKPSLDDAAAMYDKLADLSVAQARWIENEKYRSQAIAAKDSPERRVAHATALLRLHRWDAALVEIQKANAIDSQNTGLKQWLPQFELLQQFLLSIKALDVEVEKSPDDIGPLLERAHLFTVAGQPLLALEDCEHAMKLQPQSMRARVQAGEAMLDVKRNDDAAKLQISSILTREADTHVSEHKLKTLGQADAQVSREPKNAAPLAARAETLRYLHQYALALADARAALALDDKSVAAHIEAAENLDQLDQSKEALAHIIRATELDPNDSAAWFHRGNLEARRADYSAAIQSFTRSLEHGGSLEVLRAREKSERRIGQIEKADADLNRIRVLDWNTKE
jgi:tetratricopeptide (TPR) repeat protein